LLRGRDIFGVAGGEEELRTERALGRGYDELRYPLEIEMRVLSGALGVLAGCDRVR